MMRGEGKKDGTPFLTALKSTCQKMQRTSTTVIIEIYFEYCFISSSTKIITSIAKFIFAMAAIKHYIRQIRLALRQGTHD